MCERAPGKLIWALVMWAMFVGSPTLSAEEQEENSETVAVASSLRGGIKVDEHTYEIAQKMRLDGWSYHMPEPSSPDARWDNYDRRTAWWSGFWENEITGQTSLSIPRYADGKFVGDNMGSRDLRKGGPPRNRPSKLQWLLSHEGGVKPV